VGIVERNPWLLTIAIALAFVAVWHLLTLPPAVNANPAADPEYEKLMGRGAATAPAQSAIPGPGAVATRAAELLRTALRRNGENDIGIAWHLWASIQRVLLGFGLAVAVAVPLGFAIGLVPLLNRALDPFIQLLRPVSPLAWMPLALYTLKDSGASAIFIIFISALWPLLINTAYGASSVRPDWVNVARVMGLSPWKRVRRIVLPASVPMILTGMRISIGIAWFVIVAAEMVSGQSGIGFFVWNEWNNLQISSMIVAILLIGCVGLLLDQMLALLMRRLSFRE
jgi:nitrate/nitrite transport system permease protein